MVSRHLIRPGLIVVALVLGMGLAASAAEEPAAPAVSGSGAAGKTMYYRLLARKSVATIEDAIRAVARYQGGPQQLQPLAEELAFLEKKGIRFPKDIVTRKDETLTMGVAAHMLMRALNIKGGLMYKLFPGNKRYALREAMALRVVVPNTYIDQTMSGNDLVGMLVQVNEITRAEKKDVDTSPKDDK